MRKLTVAFASLGIALALPVSAATLSDATYDTAGILPDSPLSFFDQTLDSLSIFFSFTTESKIETTLAVSEERAAESAVMSSEGNVEASVAAADDSLALIDSAVKLASTADTTEESTAWTALVTESTTVSTTLLEEGLAAAPETTTVELQTSVEPIITAMAEAPKAITTTTTTTTTASCSTSTFDTCVKTNGCTEDTSKTCFVACPPRVVTCEDPKSGKTCHVPDTACVNECLAKIVGCADKCLAEANCEASQVDSAALKVLSPAEVQNAFQLQLQNLNTLSQ
ncbi:MAG: DUF5667 domain-containing protein [Patescibacteria group bacterium]|nr:MAG: DUF5667 domain-containing protein [Patescibacteria group bacterium]